MKTKLFSLVAALMFFVATAGAAVTLRYQNKDSQNHQFRVKMAGSFTKVEFSSSTTGSTTIQGGDTFCIIYTNFGEVKVKDGDEITIKDGKIIVTKSK